MACGTPVICSHASSLPEVAGDAAQMVSPGDFFGLAKALKEVMNDPKLQAEMSLKGLKQAQRFQGETMAKETLRVYESI
jgi:glycosyltransferase involved in cell wall biosynthesis